MHAPVRNFNARPQCPVCRSAETADHLVFDGIRTATCTACGFMFTRDIQSSSDIDHLYVKGYHDKRHMDGQRVNATITADLVHRFVPDLAGKSLLDIGSGYGYLLHALRHGGARQLTGVELSQAQRSYAADDLGLDIRDRLEDLAPADRFDVITLFEVIEHIPDPCEFIAQACEHLQVGGSLIIGTDNFDCDVVRVLGDKFPKWIPHEHVSLFTPASLRSVFDRVGGLRVVGVYSYTPWELLLRKWLFRATAGSKGGKSYIYRDESDPQSTRSFRFFALRLAANKLWFKLSGRGHLDGEMMYIHAIKSAPQ
jgi:2-polyprenyl-3-methyl-5-hydroxy-6-metoxy-1,4-benzoquinol methylase